MPGTMEIVLIVAVVVLLFGASRIPALAEAVGKSVRSFKKGINGDEIDVSPQGASGKIEEPASENDKNTQA